MPFCADCAAIAEELALAYREAGAPTGLRKKDLEPVEVAHRDSTARLSRAIMLKFDHELVTCQDRRCSCDPAAMIRMDLHTGMREPPSEVVDRRRVRNEGIDNDADFSFTPMAIGVALSYEEKFHL